MKNKILKLTLIIVISLIIIDQLSKFLIIKHYHEPIGNEFIKIEIAENQGIAFGINSGNNKNIIITIIVLIIIINFIRNQIERIDTKTNISVSMILAGGISNLIDRIFRGYIVDFISLNNFAIFNIADMFIVIGWILLIIFIIKFAKE